MNKKNIVIILCSALFFAYFFSKKQEPEIDFYSVKFLRNSPAVEKVLKSKGFFEADFKTRDNLMINAIMLDQSKTMNIRTTIISYPGFVPGRKEGMSTLYAMLEKEPYNFMFIDPRGHGTSQGELLTYRGIKHYGESEFLDIVAAIEFIVAYNTKENITPSIILHGLCSGAFHTIKAVAYLKKHNYATYNCIQGIVFDSGWPIMSDIAENVLDAQAEVECTSYYVPYLQPYASYILISIYNFFFKHHHQKQTPITEIIDSIDQPILFIHAENDIFVPIHNVYTLIAKAKNPKAWFVKESYHVHNHLKHKDQYKHQLQQFIESCIQWNNSLSKIK
jgi:pimeloyl-ACP methyl ester carboxylesterase